MRNTILAITIIFLGFGITESHLTVTESNVDTWEELIKLEEKRKTEYHQN